MVIATWRNAAVAGYDMTTVLVCDHVLLAVSSVMSINRTSEQTGRLEFKSTLYGFSIPRKY